MIRVAVDLMGEQKVVLAYVSMRQFWILFPSVVFCFIQLLFFNYPLVVGWWEVITKAIVTIVVLGVAASLAYIKIYKYDQYLSNYLINRLLFINSKKIYTN